MVGDSARQTPRTSSSDEIVQVEADGLALTVHSDIDRLERHVKEIAPEDADTIDEYVAAARAFTRIDLLAFPLLSPGRSPAKRCQSFR